ncbi:class I SAM-dependent methyltransferase [Gorillibacterium sp. CAU 1737]|uniref:class I SAM-dependent methyltransferase n=1 Tax=Gorillibacterium sp. CAU 1737 TaxID=3140362 RepID=UPI0032608598
MWMKQLAETTAPAAYEKGTAQMWTDPYISEQLLHAHLNPDIDAASRTKETIERSVSWIHEELCGGDHSLAILDLGCGPGLYANRLAQLGHPVTGIDFSSRSVDYARRQADEQGLRTVFEVGDYLSCEIPGTYDLILLIYCDLGALNPQEQHLLLTRVQRALKPGGRFVFDVFQPNRYRDHRNARTWHAAEGGFWRKDAYLCLESTRWYEQEGAHLHSYHILDKEQRMDTYLIWDKTFTPVELSTLLEQTGFGQAAFWGDCTGSLYKAEADMLCAVVPRDFSC